MDFGWTDYIPGLHEAHDLAKGDFSGALKHGAADLFTGGLYSPASGAYDWYTSGFDKQKAGYQEAARQAQALAEKSKQTQLQGLAQAEAYYGPAQDMYNAAYGSPDRLRK
jgi:hypothetical protein